jgi:hypothetical protein
MPTGEYAKTARTLLRLAENMTDQAVVDRLKALAEEYERRAEKSLQRNSAKPLTPLAVTVTKAR